MTKNPFSESRLLPVGLALLMVAVMLMLGWSHYRWDQTFGDSIVPLDQLADSRENTLAAEAFAERLLAGILRFMPTWSWPECSGRSRPAGSCATVPVPWQGCTSAGRRQASWRTLWTTTGRP